MDRFVVSASLAVVLLWAGAVPALAQYPPGAEETVVSDTTVVPGEDVTISSSGWQPGSQVTVEFLSTPIFLGRATVGADGSFTHTVSIPTGVSAGDHVLRLTGTDADGSPRIDEIAVTVVSGGGGAGAATGGRTAAGVGAAQSRLPATGVRVSMAAALAGVLLLAGGVALYVTRKKTGTAG